MMMTTMTTTGHPTWATALPLITADGPPHTDGCLSGNGYTASSREQRQLRRRAMQTLECLLLRARPCAGQRAGAGNAFHTLLNV